MSFSYPLGPNDAVPQFPLNATLVFNLPQIPAHAKVTLVFTPPAGDPINATVGTITQTKDGRSARVGFTPTSLGRWSFEWTARDAGDLIVGTSGGVFDIVAPEVIAMTTTLDVAP